MANITKATFWMWRNSSYTFNHELSIYHTSIAPQNLVYSEQVDSSLLPTTPSLYNWELNVAMQPGKTYMMAIAVSASDLFTKLSSADGYVMAVDWTVGGITSGVLSNADYTIESNGWGSNDISSSDFPSLIALPENASVTSSWNAAYKIIGLNFSGSASAIDSILNGGAYVNGIRRDGVYGSPFEDGGLWHLIITVSAAAEWQPGAVIEYSPFMLIPTAEDPFFAEVAIGGTSWFGVTPAPVSGITLPVEPRTVGDEVTFTPGAGSVSTNVSWMNLNDAQVFPLGSETGGTFTLPTLPEGGEYTGRLLFVSVAEHGGVGTVASSDPFTYGGDAPPHTPTPENEAAGLPLTAPVLQWECDGEPDRYDIYFGIDGNLAKIAETDDKFFQLPYSSMPDGLPLNWQVVAIYREEAAPSDVWTFECGNGIYDPEPGDGQTGVSGLLAALRWKYDSVFRHMVVSITTPGQGTMTSGWLWRVLKPEGFGEPGCQLYHYGERVSEDGGQTWLNWLFYPQSGYLDGDEVFTWSVTATIEWEGVEYEVSNTFTFQIDVPKPFDPTPEIDQTKVAVTWPLATWFYPPVPAPRFDVVVQGSKQASRLSGFEFGIPQGLLAYGQTVAWRVDGVTSFGRVRGEEWSFQTWPLAQYGEAGDITRRRLVAIADNAIWIEDDGN